MELSHVPWYFLFHDSLWLFEIRIQNLRSIVLASSLDRLRAAVCSLFIIWLTIYGMFANNCVKFICVVFNSMQSKTRNNSQFKWPFIAIFAHIEICIYKSTLMLCQMNIYCIDSLLLYRLQHFRLKWSVQKANSNPMIIDNDSFIHTSNIISTAMMEYYTNRMIDCRWHWLARANDCVMSYHDNKRKKWEKIQNKKKHNWIMWHHWSKYKQDKNINGKTRQSEQWIEIRMSSR